MDLLKKIVVSGGLILVGIIFGYSFHSAPVSPQSAQTQVEVQTPTGDVQGLATSVPVATPGSALAPATPSLKPITTPKPSPKPTVKPTIKPTPKPTIRPTPVPTIASTNSGLSNNNTYVNSQGNTVHSPAQSNSVPAGASAVCGDGSYSFSQSRSGTCSHHGGVSQWL